MPYSKGIRLEVNIIVLLEFELGNSDDVVPRVSYSTTRTLLPRIYFIIYS